MSGSKPRGRGLSAQASQCITQLRMHLAIGVLGCEFAVNGQCQVYVGSSGGSVVLSNFASDETPVLLLPGALALRRDFVRCAPGLAFNELLFRTFRLELWFAALLCALPLAAHAVWQGDTLRIDVALGHAQELARPLLRTQLAAAVGDDVAADELGRNAAAQLRDMGAADYLAAAG